MMRSVQKMWSGVLLAVLLAGCAAPLVPPARVDRAERVQEPDAELLREMRADWFALQEPGLDNAEYSRLVNRYNRALLLLLRRYRADMLQAFARGDMDYMIPGVALEHAGTGIPVPLRDVYEDMVPAWDIRTHSLQEHFTVPGIGVPMVGIVPAEKVDKTGQEFHIRTRGTVSTLTAVMEFPRREGGKPVLRLLARNDHDTILLRGQKHQLAADFSAAIEIYWNLTRVKEDRMLGLLRPQQLRDVSGLSCIEAYDADKIPVILTHGLMSSAGTFDNLVNRLLCDPLIRRNFQFWYYNYPTGVTWTLTAAHYRQALEDVRRHLDPEKKNRNWDNMVVVGHSMGGLITHYSQCTEPWLLLKGHPHVAPYMNARYVDEKLPISGGEELQKAFFFRPVKAGMVVYMATPHRGAPMARYRIVTALMKLVELPQNLVNEVVNIATLQQDMVLLNPGKLAEALTSVNQLAPDSYSIQGLQGLAVRDVPMHSIIGDRGKGNTPRSSDGVVPYWSSHFPAGSETIVPADHSVQDVPETAADLTRVLAEYLKRLGRL
ncbi:MAG: alpha/beta fold hydrolase [Akkermansia sp.]|nr:alpha/beta fold hydrolase [Akkermansia sp.]